MAQTEYDCKGYKSFEIALYERDMAGSMGRKVRKAGHTLLLILDRSSDDFEWSGCVYYKSEWFGLSKATIAKLIKDKRVIHRSWREMYPTSPIKRSIGAQQLPRHITSTFR